MAHNFKRLIVSNYFTLQKRGPQRSVDVIVSAAFLITLLLLSFLSVECLKVSVDNTMTDKGMELTRLQCWAMN
jgi:hypothetical protein